MTTDPFTDAARAEAERRWSRDQADGRPLPARARMNRRIGFEIGALWAAAQEPTDAAQIIDQHRQGYRTVGFGVTLTCECGESVYGLGPEGPMTTEDNAHRDADRKHAAHVADMLAAQEPTDAEVEAAKAVLDSVEYADEPQSIRAALSAARAARRDDTSTTPEQRIRTLHAPDAEGNCTHCTRGRVYPVPAPCETVHALAGGGEGR